MSNVILYYNKGLFDKAQVSYPTDAWTWDDFLSAAKKLTLAKSGSGKPDQWGFGLLNFVWAWAGFVWGNGGEILTEDRKQSRFDDPKTIEALNFYYGLLTSNKVSPPPGSLPQQTTALDWFSSQSVGLGLFGPWYRPVMAEMKSPFHWDVAPPPKAPKTGKPGSVVYTDMWGVYPGSKVASDAWKFMRFFSGTEGQQMWVDLLGARSITPVKSVAQTDKWLHYGGSSGQIILDALAYSQAPPVNFGNADEVENTWNAEFDLVIAGQNTVEQAVKNINQKITPILARGS
jgi:multiple sugar transport system substrate-binding protein